MSMDYNYDESQWKPIGKVSQLMMYPIKACRGISLKSVECSTYGFKVGKIFDRGFMVIDDRNCSIDNYTEKNLMNIKPSIPDENLSELWIDAPGKETLKINMDELHKKKQIKHNSYMSDPKLSQAITAFECGNEVNEWFSSYLNKNYKLVYYDQMTIPRFSKAGEPTAALTAKHTDMIMFSNTTTYMMLSQSSLRDYNERFSLNVVAERFRPNILIEDTPPYEEDLWKYVKINDARFRFIRLCARCRNITIDPLTALRDEHFETLKYLRTYRQSKDPELRKIIRDDPLFGVNFGIDRKGKISIGDPCYAVYKSD